MKAFAYTFLFFLSVNAFAQRSSSGDSLTIDLLLDKSRDFEQVNADSSLYYANEAYTRSIELKSTYLQAASVLQLAVVSFNIADYKKATVYYKEGISLSEKTNNKQLLARALNGFANMFANQKQFDQAYEYFQRALALSRELNDTRKVSVILMNLANIEYDKAYHNGDFTKVNLAYKEAYEWAVLSKDTSQVVTCLGNWGLSYSDEGKFDLALEKLNTAIELATRLENKADLVFLFYYKGRTFSLMDQNQKALVEYNKSMELAREFKDMDFIAENYLGIAESNYGLGNYKTAYENYRTYKSMEDSIANKEIASELNSIKVKYDTEKKQKEIELLRVNANKDKIVKFGLLAGAVLLLVLAFLMFNRYRLKEKTNKLLEQQNSIISEKNKDISDSINYAKKIQDAILPSLSDIKTVFPESFILSIPKDVVSGDFYWFAKIGELKLFVVADCTGHGVPGAFMSMIGNTLLNNIVVERKITRPDIILNELRNEIMKSLKQGETSESKDGMDLSLICIDSSAGTVQVACANNPVWVLKNDNSMLEIKPDKQPIGYASSDHKAFTLNTITIEKGDIIYQFTDGYADQFGGDKGKKFKYNRLKEMLSHLNTTTDIKTQDQILKQNFMEWKGNLEQIDDVLVSGIRID
jgi:serine phosphatase RsbU (regulator of sigma subunit)